MHAARMTTPTQESHPLGSQLLQFMWESFAVDLNGIASAPASHRERRILDAGVELMRSLAKLGFSEAQAEEYRTLYSESLRAYLNVPAQPRGMVQ